MDSCRGASLSAQFNLPASHSPNPKPGPRKNKKAHPDRCLKDFASARDDMLPDDVSGGEVFVKNPVDDIRSTVAVPNPIGQHAQDRTTLADVQATGFDANHRIGTLLSPAFAA